MATQDQRRPARPTTPADLWRLAEQAHAKGVQLLHEGMSGEAFATSTSEPGTIHRLTAYSCTCKGFCYHQRCQHHALLLESLGWLPDPEPAPGPAAGLASAELVALKADAMRRHALRGEALVNVETGALIAPAA